MDWSLLSGFNADITTCHCEVERIEQFAGTHVYWDYVELYTQARGHR